MKTVLASAGSWDGLAILPPWPMEKRESSHNIAKAIELDGSNFMRLRLMRFRRERLSQTNQSTEKTNFLSRLQLVGSVLLRERMFERKALERWVRGREGLYVESRQLLSRTAANYQGDTQHLHQPVRAIEMLLLTSSAH